MQFGEHGVILPYDDDHGHHALSLFSRSNKCGRDNKEGGGRRGLILMMSKRSERNPDSKQASARSDLRCFLSSIYRFPVIAEKSIHWTRKPNHFA